MTPRISIIIPVYNAEAYLNRCLDSILAQTYKDFEVLLIDDGSTDGSGRICDEYASRDSRICVVHQPNKGVASARQWGVDNARGVYSIHVDSDDWAEPDMLREMYHEAMKADADIVIADYLSDEEPTRYISQQKQNNPTGIAVLKDIISGRAMGSLWNKLIRHSLYAESKTRFNPDIFYCEDVLVLIDIMLGNPKIRFLNKAFYHYNKTNTNSITVRYTAQTYANRKKYLAITKNKLTMPEFRIPLRLSEFAIIREAYFRGGEKASALYRAYPAEVTFMRKIPIPPLVRIKLLLMKIIYKPFHNNISTCTVEN